MPRNDTGLKWVSETAEEVNETNQEKNNADKEAQLLQRTDNRKHYYQQYRERQRNVKSLEEVVHKLSLPQKKKEKVKQSFFKTSRSSELIACDASLAYPKYLWKNCAFPAFHRLLFDLENYDFLK